MFDVGFAEVFLLGLIGLLILGPERLPAVARTLGGLVRKARASWAGLRSTIEAELAEADITNPIKEVGDELKQIGADIKSDLPDANSILNPEAKSAAAKEAKALSADDDSDHESSKTEPDPEVESNAETDTETGTETQNETGDLFAAHEDFEYEEPEEGINPEQTPKSQPYDKEL